MAQTGITQFTGVMNNAALAGAQRVTVEHNQVQTAHRGIAGKTLAALSGTLMQHQNRATITAFRDALTERYGAIGTNVFNAQLAGKLANGRSLLKSDIAAAIGTASLRSITPLAQGGAARADMLAREAVSKMTFSDPLRGEMLKPVILAALTSVANSVDAIDRSANKAVLVDLGNALAKQLDEKYLLNAVGQHLIAQGTITQVPGSNPALYTPSLHQAVQALANAHGGLPGALAHIRNTVPALHQAINDEVAHFTQNMNTMSGRVAADMAGIAADFANAWPGGAVPTGIVGVKVTSSDPHHGGNRVLILSLDNNQKIVYKPRDTRIDAKLVGHTGAVLDNINGLPANDGNRSIIELGNTLLESANPGTPLMETYQYRNGNDANGHYGYVQFKSNGTVGDNSMTMVEGQAFHRNLGRQMALMNLLGVRDLHQTNMMVSGKQPFFTDVEIAFDEQTLGNVQADLANPLQRQMPGHLMQAQITNLFGSATENVHSDSAFTIDDNGRVKQNLPHHTEFVVENMIHVAGGNPPTNRTAGQSVHRQFANDFTQGYLEMMQAIGQNAGTVARFQAMIGNFAGLHVRHHPVPTPDQLNALQLRQFGFVNNHPTLANVQNTLQNLANANTGIQQNVINQRGSALEHNNVTATIAAQVQDLTVGDVPYFTRQLGQDQLLHNGANPIVVNQHAATLALQRQFFMQDPIAMSQALVGQLDPNVNGGALLANIANTFVATYTNYFNNLQNQPINQAVVDEWKRTADPALAILV